MADSTAWTGELTDEQVELRERFTDEVGYWNDLYEDVVRIDPTFFEYYTEILAHPHRHGSLDPKVREFMLIAVNAATTQLHTDGVRTHIGRALDHGAEFEEIVEVLQRTSGLGIHSITQGVPILEDFFGPAPEPTSDEAAEQDRVREKFEQQRGYWSERWESVLRTDHRFLDAYTDLSSHPYVVGPLDEKVKEFLSIAYDTTTTNLYTPGTRVHVENALKLGATREEVMEVLELAVIVGFHTLTESAPILIEEAAKREKLPDQ